MNLKRNCLTILVLAMFTMSFCYFHVKEAFAVTYEFETGFEETDPFGNWTPCPVNGYGYEIQTTIVHGGVNACRSKEDDGYMTYELASNYSKHYSMVYFYINGTVPEAYGGGLFIRVWDPEIAVYIETNASRGAGKSPYIRFYDQMNDDFDVLDSEGLTLGAWHTVAVYIEGDSASANHKCWVDSRLIASVSDDTSGYNVTGVTIQSNYWTAPYTGKVIIDDFASNDDVPLYYFNFNFKDLDSEDVELYVDWALWNSTHDLEYGEGETSLYNGTYTLKTSKYGHLINTTTLDTGTYGNSTINIYLNMKRHQSCPNGFIASNDTISSLTVHAETPQLLNFTIDGNTPAQLGVGVSKNASYIGKTAWESPEAIHSYCGYYSTNIPENAIDDNLATFWRHANPCYHWIIFDMNKSKLISKMRIYQSSDPTRRWGLSVGLFVYVSDDPTDFGDAVWQGPLNAGGWQESGDFRKNGRYVKLVSKTNSNAERMYEFDAETRNENLTEWKYVSSPSHIHFNQSSFSTFAFVFPASSDPVVGPHGPNPWRVKVNVRLNGEWLKGANVTVEGGPFNRSEWGLTDAFGGVKFKLKTGSYDIVASYQQYRKTKPVYVSMHMTIGIDLTKEDIITPDLLPEDVKDFFEELASWVNLPELDLTTETFLVFILPLIVLVVYAVKKASEGPKRKWKYSYLK